VENAKVGLSLRVQEEASRCASATKVEDRSLVVVSVAFGCAHLDQAVPAWLRISWVDSSSVACTSRAKEISRSSHRAHVLRHPWFSVDVDLFGEIPGDAL